MRNIVLFFVGIGLLLLAGFFGFASSPDYWKILTLSLIFDFFAIAAFGVLILSAEGTFRIAAMALVVVSGLIGCQAIYRMCII